MKKLTANILKGLTVVGMAGSIFMTAGTGAEAESRKSQDLRMSGSVYECEAWVDPTKKKNWGKPVLKGIKGTKATDKLCKAGFDYDYDYVLLAKDGKGKKATSGITFYNGSNIRDIVYNGSRVEFEFNAKRKVAKAFKSMHGKPIVYTVRIKNYKKMPRLKLTATKLTTNIRKGENSERTPRLKAKNITLSNIHSEDGKDKIVIKGVKKGQIVRIYGANGYKYGEVKAKGNTVTYNKIAFSKSYRSDKEINITVENPQFKYMESAKVFKKVPKQIPQQITTAPEVDYVAPTKNATENGIFIEGLKTGYKYNFYVNGKKIKETLDLTNPKSKFISKKKTYLVKIKDKNFLKLMTILDAADMKQLKNYTISFTATKKGLKESKKVVIKKGADLYDSYSGDLEGSEYAKEYGW